MMNFRMTTDDFEVLAGYVSHRLGIVARFEGEINWVISAIERGNYDGIRVESSGRVYALFSGVSVTGSTWSDEILVNTHWLTATEKELEKEYSALATKRDRDERARKNIKKEEELKEYRKLYKLILNNEKSNSIGT